MNHYESSKAKDRATFAMERLEFWEEQKRWDENHGIMSNISNNRIEFWEKKLSEILAENE